MTNLSQKQQGQAFRKQGYKRLPRYESRTGTHVFFHAEHKTWKFVEPDPIVTQENTNVPHNQA